MCTHNGKFDVIKNNGGTEVDDSKNNIDNGVENIK